MLKLGVHAQCTATNQTALSKTRPVPHQHLQAKRAPSTQHTSFQSSAEKGHSQWGSLRCQHLHPDKAGLCLAVLLNPGSDGCIPASLPSALDGTCGVILACAQPLPPPGLHLPSVGGLLSTSPSVDVDALVLRFVAHCRPGAQQTPMWGWGCRPHPTQWWTNRRNYPHIVMAVPGPWSRVALRLQELESGVWILDVAKGGGGGGVK